MNKKRLRTLTEAVSFYKARHRTPGCKLTHMVGIPLLLLAPFVFLFDKRSGCLFGITGTLFQFLGHFLFEKNMPTLIETSDPMMVPAAVIFTVDEWRDVLAGSWIADNGTDLFAKGKIMSSAPELSQPTNGNEAASSVFVHSTEQI